MLVNRISLGVHNMDGQRYGSDILEFHETEIPVDEVKKIAQSVAPGRWDEIMSPYPISNVRQTRFYLDHSNIQSMPDDDLWNQVALIHVPSIEAAILMFFGGK